MNDGFICRTIRNCSEASSRRPSVSSTRPIIARACDGFDPQRHQPHERLQLLTRFAEAARPGTARGRG